MFDFRFTVHTSFQAVICSRLLVFMFSFCGQSTLAADPEKQPPESISKENPKQAPVDSPLAKTKAAFQSRDINQDGQVTAQEFIAAFPKEKQPIAKRDFQLFNRDGDKNLSFNEYRTIPGLTPFAVRGELTHPLTALVDQRLSVIDKHWKSWDADGNDSLSPEELKNAKINKQIPGLPPVELKDWDRDGDEKVNREDCRRVIEAGYGLRRLDGQPLQLPSGLVVYWWYFKSLDLDHDDSLALKEFMTYFKRFGEEVGTKRFQEADTDQNEKISLTEWAQMRGHLLNPIVEFRRMDLNHDASLDESELMEGTPSFLRPLASHTFPGFDLNQDGMLSLDEYRTSLPANRVENWASYASDMNKDGRLSLTEMGWTPGLELSLLRQEYFDRLDINDSGYLELNEFKFIRLDSSLEKTKAAFQSRDANQDGQVTAEEFVASFPKKKQPEAKRDFKLFNRDGDKNLSFNEYRTIPGLTPSALLGELTHPLAALVDQQLSVIDKHWKSWDTDGNNNLSPEELKNAKINKQIPGLPPVFLKEWDRDGDGQISREDCQRVIEAGYGLRRLDGQPLHLPTGQIVYWWHFKALDLDHDDSLSLKEFMTYFQRLGEEIGTKRFEEADTDQNEKITLSEWAQMPGHLLNPIVEFRRMDLNHDASLDESELMEGTPSFLRPLANHTFPGFDLNQDGMLSLDEYRTSLPANRIDIWASNSRDVDQDGRLSLTEMTWTPGLELSLLRQEYFDRLDINDSGYLEFNEFKYMTLDSPLLKTKAVFQSRDINQDGQVTETEFPASFPKEKQQGAKRDFLLFNRDGDEVLSFNEYCSIPGMAPSPLHGSLTNPLMVLVDRQMEKINKHWKQWDKDQNDTLSSKEFQKAGIGRQIPGLALSTWQDWDRNADGTISRDDCRWLLEAGYGLRRMDGQPLHLPTGQIVFWWHFKSLDEDHDDSLTLAEFMAYFHRMGEEAGTKRFQEADTDQNAKITLSEWGQMPGHLLNPIVEFRRMDLNLDASLDENELMEGTPPFLRPLASHTFPGFDLNRDGVLSLDEYRTSLPANRVENWASYARDIDKDGRLSLAEMAWTPGLELSLLRQEYFDHLDINDSGYLDFNEFKFKIIDLRNVPKELFLTHCDENQDGLLTLDEFLTTEKNSGKIKLDGSHELRVLKIEEAFYEADVNGDKLINLAEFDTAAGNKIIAPFKFGNKSSLQATNKASTSEDDSSMLIIVLGLNVFLVLGVVTFLLRSRFKKA